MLQPSRTTNPLTAYSRPRTLSKSDYKLARTCDTKLYFRENGYPDNRAHDPYLRLLAEGGYMVEALARARFTDGIQLDYGRDLRADFEQTMSLLLRNDVTLFEATLVSARRQARVDILEKRGNEVRLIEVKAKSFDGPAHAADLADGGVGSFLTKRNPHRIVESWREKLEDITYQVLLLERVLPGVTIRPHLILVDRSKRARIDDVPGFFELLWSEGADGEARLDTARFRGSRDQLASLDLLAEVDVSREVELLREEVEEAAAIFEARLDAPFPAHETERGAKCAECEFRHDAGVERNGFAECWGKLAHVDPHVLEMHAVGQVDASDGSPLVGSLFREGKASLLDIPIELLVTAKGDVGARATRQRRQIDCARRGEPYVGGELRNRIDALSYPLHFVDFEASRLALPYHAGMRPYGLVAFQWSCHTLAAPGAELVHSEWLNAVDYWPNRAFAESLRAQVGDTGSILTWSHFENTTMKDIAAELPSRYPDAAGLVEWLGSIGSRVADMEKWARNDYYHPGMRGRTSIKLVLEALWNADPLMREECARWSSVSVAADRDPYAGLPAIVIAGQEQDVREGTAAVRAYQHMMYGAARDPEAKAGWARLLRQYCELDTLSMVLIFNHWRRLTSV